jgi:hypothetical protein
MHLFDWSICRAAMAHAAARFARAACLILPVGALLACDVCQAAIFTVTGTGEPPTATSAVCGVNNYCGTFRDAMNSAIASADSTSVVRFDAAVDGQTINLVWCSNAGTGTEFGRSAFFITNSKGILIDGVQSLPHGVTIARDLANAQNCAAAGNAPTGTFRLFDVDQGATLVLSGLTLKNGAAVGGSSRYGGGALGAGGAVFNQGGLTVDRCTFIDNVAQGGSGGDSTLNFGGAGVGGDATSSAGGAPNGGSGIGFNPGGFGGGGSAYEDGADGGFGGGGGQGGLVGGNGGFGGGGGARGNTASGSGGFGGGNGGIANPTDGGGGGAGMGGAIFNDAGTLTITNSTFTGNRALGGNGGGSNAGNGSGFGGAVFNYSGPATLVYVTMTGNSVGAGTGGNGGIAEGAGVYDLADSACNTGGNSCPPDAATATFTFRTSIIAGNTGAAHDLFLNQINSGSVIYSCRGNLITTPAPSSTGCIVSTLDPLLSPLGYYGGTSPTRVPAQTSPAVDAVGCESQIATTDQRGIARAQGSQCDIGAVEYDGDYLFANGFD